MKGRSTPKAVLAAWAVAFNQHNIDALAELYASDAVNFQTPEEPVRGRKAIVEGLRMGFKEFPDMGFDLLNLYEDGDWAIIEWLGWSTHKSKIGDPAFAGKDGPRMHGCGFFRIEDGLIQYQRGYWDKLTWQQQAGLPQ